MQEFSGGLRHTVESSRTAAKWTLCWDILSSIVFMLWTELSNLNFLNFRGREVIKAPSEIEIWILTDNEAKSKLKNFSSKFHPSISEVPPVSDWYKSAKTM